MKTIDHVLDRAAKRDRLLLLLDFDGTLCEIVEHPKHARLSAKRRSALRGLLRKGVLVAFLSGRSMESLRKRVLLDGAFYGSNFGLELEGPGLRFRHPSVRAARQSLEKTHRTLESLFKGVDGIYIEDKGASLSLHFRSLSIPERRFFRSRLKALRNGTEAGIHWRKGKKTWNLMPTIRWNKGKAANYLWRKLGRPYLVAIGDDASDEEMFRAVQRHGTALRVGPGRTRASVRLRNVAQVYDFLGELCLRRSRTPAP